MGARGLGFRRERWGLGRVIDYEYVSSRGGGETMVG